MPTGVRENRTRRADTPSATLAPLMAELSQAHRQIAEQAERIGRLETELALERQRVEALERRAEAVRVRAGEIRERALLGAQRKHASPGPQPDRDPAAVAAAVLSRYEVDAGTLTASTAAAHRSHSCNDGSSGDTEQVDPEWQLDEAWWRTTTGAEEISPSLPLVSAAATPPKPRRKRWWR
jgi:hypothetical protein